MPEWNTECYAFDCHVSAEAFANTHIAKNLVTVCSLINDAMCLLHSAEQRNGISRNRLKSSQIDRSAGRMCTEHSAAKRNACPFPVEVWFIQYAKNNDYKIVNGARSMPLAIYLQASNGTREHDSIEILLRTFYEACIGESNGICCFGT